MEQATAPSAPAEGTNSTTIADLLPLAAGKYAGHVFGKVKADDQWQDITYEQLGATVREVAKGLIALGIEHQDKVSILANTRIEWTYCDFGALCAGACVAPIYQTNSPEECHYVLEHSEAKAVFVENREQLEKIHEVQDRLPGLEHVIVMEPDGGPIGDAITLDELRQKGAEIEDSAVEERVAAVSKDDLCTIIYTSGTTGPPKGCLITHGNYRATTSMGVSLVADLEEAQVENLVYLFLPLAHSFALLEQFVTIDLGATIAYWEGDPQKIVPNLMEVKPTVFPSVPRIFEKIYTLANSAAASKPPEEQEQFKQAIDLGFKVRMMQHNGQEVPAELMEHFNKADELVYQNVRNLFGGRIFVAITGAAPIAREILEFFYACGILVCEGYGMTETATLSTANTPKNFKFGSIGKPVPGVQVKIAEDGEILVSGANIFQGYYKNQDATDETIDTEKWLHTGDLGTIDEDGFVFITGRKKDIIITAGGKNLTPANFENAMKQNRWVSQAVMYGDKRPYPSAIITLDPEELPAFAAQLGIEDADNAAMAKNPAVIAEIQKVVDNVNSEISRVGQVKKFTILDHDLSQPTGELTPTLKVKRNVVYEKYADIFNAMYAND
jgi:long-chain acyl-CoA synthetase